MKNDENTVDTLDDVFDEQDDNTEKHFFRLEQTKLFNIGYKAGIDEEYVEESQFYRNGYTQGLLHGFRSTLPIAQLLGRIRLVTKVPIPALENLYKSIRQPSYFLPTEDLKELDNVCVSTDLC